MIEYIVTKSKDACIFCFVFDHIYFYVYEAIEKSLYIGFYILFKFYHQLILISSICKMYTFFHFDFERHFESQTTSVKT